MRTRNNNNPRNTYDNEQQRMEAIQRDLNLYGRSPLLECDRDSFVSDNNDDTDSRKVRWQNAIIATLILVAIVAIVLLGLGAAFIVIPLLTGSIGAHQAAAAVATAAKPAEGE